MTRRRIIGARRDRGAQYLLFTIASFAIAVAATRWYLDLAGYPMVGGGELHVAHALWGGLALVIAALLPLLWVGRRSLVLSAVLAGVGAGLFIDEVGKFLTTSTDYFFAPAAPIIYGSLLLLVLLWLLIRRSKLDRYEATHAVLQALGDAVDGRLTQHERERIRRIRHEAGEPLEGGIDAQLLAVLESRAIDGRLTTGGPMASGTVRRWLQRLLPTRLEGWLIYLGLTLSVFSAFFAALGLVVLATMPELAVIDDLDTGRIEFPDDIVWSLLLLAIYVVTGTTALVALVLRIARSPRWLDVALVAVLIDLVVGELVAFYAAQFTALAGAIWSVALLGLVIDLRIRRANADVDPSVAET